MHEFSSDFYYLSEVSCLNSFKSLKENLPILRTCYYILELSLKFLEEESDRGGFFDDLLNILSLLNIAPDYASLIVINFQLFFLNYLGYGLTLDKCVVCYKPFTIKEAETFLLDFNKGGLVCNTCSSGLKLSKNNILMLYFLAKPLTAASLKNPRLKDINVSTLYFYLQNYLSTVLDINIKSLKML